MSEEEPQSPYAELGIPGLLRGARRAYANVVRAALAEAGFDDMPRNGAYVLARVYGDSTALVGLAKGLGISKQAVSQLIDTMVMRGYLDRTPDPEDRRRMLLTLTARGEAAAIAGWRAATAADDELERRVKPAGVAALRHGLIALCEMADESDEGQAGTEPVGAPGRHSHDE